MSNVKENVQKAMEKKQGAKKDVQTEASESAKNAVATQETPKRNVPTKKASRKLQADLGSQEPWYLSREGDLADVTSEDHNEKLGIKKIDVYHPSDRQIEFLTIAIVRVDTVVGRFPNIQVRESKNETSNDIYMMDIARNIAKEGEPSNWMADLEFSSAFKAQILSYVETLLQ